MAGNKRIRRQRRRTVKKRKSAGFMGRMIALVLFAVIIIAVFTVSQNIYYYITGSRIDSSNPYPVKGVDVSEFQKEIDWKGLEKEGYRFAFIKATEGSSLTDSNFEYNWKEAGRTDMKISAYHFLSYDSSGVTQAENYINNVEKKRGMMPPAIDVEFYGIYNEKHPEHVKVYEVLDVMLEGAIKGLNSAEDALSDPTLVQEFKRREYVIVMMADEYASFKRHLHALSVKEQELIIPLLKHEKDYYTLAEEAGVSVPVVRRKASRIHCELISYMENYFIEKL